MYYVYIYLTPHSLLDAFSDIDGCHKLTAGCHKPYLLIYLLQAAQAAGQITLTLLRKWTLLLTYGLLSHWPKCLWSELSVDNYYYATCQNTSRFSTVRDAYLLVLWFLCVLQWHTNASNVRVHIPLTIMFVEQLYITFRDSFCCLYINRKVLVSHRLKVAISVVLKTSL